MSLTPPLSQIRAVLEHAAPADSVNASAFSRRRNTLSRAVDGDGAITAEAVAKLLDDAVCSAEGPVARVGWNFAVWWVRDWISKNARPADTELLVGYDLFAEATR